METASERLAAPIFVKMAARCCFTASAEMSSIVAMSRLVSPRVTDSSMTFCLSVSFGMEGASLSDFSIPGENALPPLAARHVCGFLTHCCFSCRFSQRNALFVATEGMVGNVSSNEPQI